MAETERREFKGAICASVSPGAGFGAHTAQSQPGRGGGGTHVSMATLFVVVVFVVAAASGAVVLLLLLLLRTYFFSFDDVIGFLFGRSNSSPPSSLLDSLSHTHFSHFSLSLSSFPLSSLSLFIYMYSVIYSMIYRACVLCVDVYAIQFCKNHFDKKCCLGFRV